MKTKPLKINFKKKTLVVFNTFSLSKAKFRTDTNDPTVLDTTSVLTITHIG